MHDEFFAFAAPTSIAAAGVLTAAGFPATHPTAPRRQLRYENNAFAINRAQTAARRRRRSCNSDARALFARERRLLWAAIVRRHHEAAASAIVSALAMVIPVAGVLWARAVSLQRGAPPATRPREAADEREA
jgi:hypothetical protein